MSCHAEVLNECNVHALSCHGATNQQGRHLVSSFDRKGYCYNNTQSRERQQEMAHIQGPVTSYGRSWVTNNTQAVLL